MTFALSETVQCCDLLAMYGVNPDYSLETRFIGEHNDFVEGYKAYKCSLNPNMTKGINEGIVICGPTEGVGICEVWRNDNNFLTLHLAALSLKDGSEQVVYLNNPKLANYRPGAVTMAFRKLGDVGNEYGSNPNNGNRSNPYPKTCAVNSFGHKYTESISYLSRLAMAQLIDNNVVHDRMSVGEVRYLVNNAMLTSVELFKQEGIIKSPKKLGIPILHRLGEVLGRVPSTLQSIFMLLGD